MTGAAPGSSSDEGCEGADDEEEGDDDEEEEEEEAEGAVELEAA